MVKTFMGKVVRRQKARALQGLKLAYDNRPIPKHKSKAISLPGPLFDVSVVSLGILGLVTYLWPS